MSVKEHYDNHLGNFYSWMVGDFEIKQNEQQDYFESRNIRPTSTGQAIDLGAGHGIQSISLAKIGFTVKAIDFNRQLLNELEQNSIGLPIEIINADIKSVRNYTINNSELIICAGDTITHLNNIKEVEQLIEDCAGTLYNEGKLILSFRDYTKAVSGNDRFIFVKSDESRILTCCLDYFDDKVLVTDLLNSKTEADWKQSISSYYKVRITSVKIESFLNKHGFKIQHKDLVNRMVTIIAQKE
ncbi:methyltransferase domain-containing protein [uncultured Mucilaginibacter sp.]|uniref:class I SAM-dependent methyltransferase n=1 Tax=uncultured Mucilaginibacter sp. TaxID=797541 RepID=UPI00260E14F8|nr:methyltransferase domain-containing protein [uncultured Mucilaginibacter sp.]